MAFFARITRAVAPAAIAFGGASALAFCDDGKYIWTLRGDHTTRVLVKDQLIRTSDIDERVAAYFADREETIELPEKKVLEWSAESDSPTEEEALSPPDEHVWVLKGDHTTRVSSEDRAAVVASLDASVAKYFAEARGETYEPEEEAEEEPEELVEAVEDVPVEVEDEVESAPPSESDAQAALIAELLKRLEALEAKAGINDS